MKRLLTDSAVKTRDWLVDAPGGGYGVTGFRCWKFWAVLALYMAAFLLLVRDPFFFRSGAFSYQQGMVTLLLAFVLTAALSWELVVLGPARGANLLLQLALCLPMCIFIARITAQPSAPPAEVGMLQIIGGGFGELSAFLGLNRLAEYIPYWIRDLFANWRVTLFFMGMMLAMSFRSLGIKLSLMSLLVAVEWFSAFDAAAASPKWLIGGTVCLLAGLGLQFCRYDRIIYYENVVARLAAGPVDEVAMRAILRLATLGREEGRISEEALRRVVKSEYGVFRDFSRVELRYIAADLTERMIYEYQIVHLTGDHNGMFLIPSRRLCRYNTVLGSLSVWPRVFMTLLIAAVWVLMPVDLIPDAIPFIGMLDDVTVTILAGLVVKNAVEE